MTQAKWNPEEAGKAAGLAERGGGPAAACTARRPPNWRPGMSRLTATQVERGKKGGRASGNARTLKNKLDRVLGPVEEDES
jgi:hypothetical protein